jgi:hypothetical protein
MMKRLEARLQQSLFQERDSAKSCEKGMHYYTNTNQTPTKAHQQTGIIRCD